MVEEHKRKEEQFEGGSEDEEELDHEIELVEQDMESYVSDEDEFLAAKREYNTEVDDEEDDTERHRKISYVLSLWEFEKVPRKIKQVFITGKRAVSPFRERQVQDEILEGQEDSRATNRKHVPLLQCGHLPLASQNRTA